MNFTLKKLESGLLKIFFYDMIFINYLILLFYEIYGFFYFNNLFTEKNVQSSKRFLKILFLNEITVLYLKLSKNGIYF